LIVLQGYPDSNEYKASVEWNLFRAGYDTDGKLLSEVGNGSNEYTEKYPLYLVTSALEVVQCFLQDKIVFSKFS